MGLFDIFQRGGKYFDKDIPPHCEYCDFGKRAKDGNKVLCDKRGLVDADFSCAKFVYSPLKRIPVKQLNRVGFLDEDDEFNDDDEQEEPQKQPDVRQAPPPLQAADAAPTPVTSTPKPVAPAPQLAAPAPQPVAPAPQPVAPAPTPEEKSVQNGAPVPEEAPASDTPKQEAASADAAVNTAALEAEKAMEAAFQAMNQPKKS